MQKSERADAEGGVAVGESESGIDLGEFATAEEAVAVGELGVVLDGAFFRRVGDSGGGVMGPLPYRVGVAVVHRERVHVALATVPEGEEQHNSYETQTDHFLFPLSNTVESVH